MTQPDGTARVVVRDVTKTFGATRALAGADLEIRAGEVHTVMGENGSGKSSLAKILSGVHRPDSGQVYIDGCAATSLRSPARSHGLGISTVFQEVLTLPGQTILENIWIGAKRSALSALERRERAAGTLTALLGEQVDVDAPIEALSLSGRQAACITRSLVQGPSLLVLDESTSALDIATRDRLFGLVRDLTSGGGSVLFISHRMDEVFQISDVITVLRGGRTVAARLDASATNPGELVKLMSGVDADVTRRVSRSSAEPVLRVDQVSVDGSNEPLSVTLRAGEVLGLAGLEGQGQDAFLKALRGVAVNGNVIRHIEGADQVVDGPARARALGIGYVPRERRREGIFEPLSVMENFGLPTQSRDTRAGVIRSRRTLERLKRLAAPLRVKMGHAGDLITTLSGGNQQKVVLARTLADAPQVLLLNDPTRGIDQNAKHDVYATLDDLASRGVAIVVLSSEVDELVHLADRVLVFKDGRVSALLQGDEVTRSAIVAAYFGSRPSEPATAPSGKETRDVNHAPSAD
ncbi:sugar ABC transporter ATP-binding protein [Actinoplanes subtropicus]|uniref:sugar ABC transporter ATP-binding protein n=1 Tax=Actinoplanes subtropicus TaxID=543632 RepID=UPI00068F9D97|nr:sugar ABC transporter ATP-binding protein [Actinoplanes subtropicus]